MNCGTERGWNTHKSNNERPCKWCLLWKEKHDAGLVKVAPMVKPGPKPKKKARPTTTAKPRELRPCGTPAAYQRHLIHKEEPCDPCRKAATEQREARKRARREREGKTAPVPRTPAKCGTAAGRSRHKRAGEPVCGPCRLAYNEKARKDAAAKAEKEGRVIVPRPVPQCGTVGGYSAHRKRGEETCRACKDAHNAKQRENRDARIVEAGGEPRRKPVAACGTPSGYMGHLSRGEETCRECKDAHSAEKRERKARRKAEQAALELAA